jgi:6-pyruvoyltetrahydropterin 2'-reductase
MKVVESFFSIQGEGRYAGRFAYFARLFGCNLSCPGFGVRRVLPSGREIIGCDTIRAVNGEFGYSNLSANDLLEEVSNLISNLNVKPLVVVTGGEPLLWQRDEDFRAFVAGALDMGCAVQFETNGTIAPGFKFEPLKKCVFAVSPKLSFSGEAREKRLKFENLKAIFGGADAFYKFVTSGARSELAEIDEILGEQAGETWLMPLGASERELAANAARVARVCVERGFNYSDRLQIRLWNTKEGV